MGVTRDQVITYLSALAPSELHELILALEDLWSLEPVEAARALEPWVEMGMPALPSLILREVGTQRISVMKLVRATTGCSLREARDRVDEAPVELLVEVDRDEFVQLRQQFEAVGARVELG